MAAARFARTLVKLAIALASLSAFADPPRLDPPLPRPTNLTFSEAAANGAVPGWFVLPASVRAGYRFALAAAEDCRTPPCARFHLAEKTQRPGFVLQTVDATALRGKRIAFKAAVRFEGAAPRAAQAQLWIRVDRPIGHVGFFDEMADRPIISKNWDEYEIIGNVDDDATAVSFGLRLTGGSAWLENVRFSEIPGVAAVNEPARAISGRGRGNLIAFAKLFGYVRYFHPSDEAAAANWLEIAVEGVRRVEDARSPAELAIRLSELFRPVAPTLRVFVDGHRPAVAEALRAPADPAVKVVHWNHHGPPSPFTTDPAYVSKRIEQAPADLDKDVPPPQEPLLLPLGSGVSVLLPIALYVDGAGTLPHARRESLNPAVKYRLPPWSALDRATRLAAVVVAWNVFQHFYPYFDVVQADWPAELTRALARAATDRDERSLLETLGRLTVPLHDGHVFVQHPINSDSYRPPLTLAWVENRLAVCHVDDEFLSLKPGDVVTRINGKSVAELISAQEAITSGARPELIRFRALAVLLSGLENTEVELDVEPRVGKPFRASLMRTVETSFLPTEYRPAQLQEVAPGIFYVDVDRFSESEFTANLERLVKAQGIIFDVRGIPSGEVKPLTILGHLSSKPLDSAQWAIPVTLLPDRLKMSFDIRRWAIDPKEPRLTARLAFLENARAISYFETLLGILESYKLGTFVGENSAATNGNVSLFSVPGGYRLRFTGLKAIKHDGSQHHGIGIPPDVVVHRTLAGLAERRDEILERAVAILQTQLSSSAKH